MAVKFNIITKVENLVGYVFIITEKAPKKFRTDISSQLRIKAMYIQENIVRAKQLIYKGAIFLLTKEKIIINTHIV